MKNIIGIFLCCYIVLIIGGCNSRHRLSADEDQQYKQRMQQTEAAVSKWIKTYALHPASYTSVSFSDYSESILSINNREIDSTKMYCVKHVHYLKNRDGKADEFEGFFKLNSAYEVNMIHIAEDSMAAEEVFPPDISTWTKQFGRPLTKQEKSEITYQVAKHQAKSVRELKELLTTEAIEIDDTVNEQRINRLIDTVILRIDKGKIK
ncbi:hypothetical protein [Hymenobacter weizhouensis]|uniref:hypothetical protein n=1 Tax=Hymenobacter sp. YIM 151500-1 TaxID=2987689 RepID=UPI002226BE49|nr:hypothetical protein [Hymenobacter sp. YIM 151500-1]UYZ63748.1 hypothetical protein OIS53_02635 [Hymenobacter sp. YIM 151500-1]